MSGLIFDLLQEQELNGTLIYAALQTGLSMEHKNDVKRLQIRVPETVVEKLPGNLFGTIQTQHTTIVLIIHLKLVVTRSFVTIRVHC